MGLLSRPSLRSVRRNPEDRSGNDGRPPPMKKQRTLEEYGLRRRRSSPDCLDTTTTQDTHPVGKVRSANPPLSATRPRTATRRARQHSSASPDSINSLSQLKTPARFHANGNGSVASPRVPDRNTPSAIHHLHDDRESPDPLDTISPAPTISTTIRPRSRASAHASEAQSKFLKSPATTRSTRKNDPDPILTEPPTDTIKEEKEQDEPEKLPVKSAVAEPRSHQKRRSDLDLLENEPAPVSTGTERRSLRSADTGSRKSELAQYFYNYEQIISLDQSKPETLTAATIVTLIDDLSEPLPLSTTPDPTPFGNPLKQLHNCEVISLSVSSPPPEDDPLNEELYFRAHRRFERQEKQLRNIERDRAQHEKQQVDRLLEELRGQDWLRLMGLPGVHESEKKLYEPKRQILIAELVALLNKFQVWKDEERRRKLAREKSSHLVDEAEARRPQKRSLPIEEAEESSLSPCIPPSTPDPNDVDAWAARQLHQEARSASDSAAKIRKSVKPKAGPDDDEQSHPTEKSAAKRPKAHDPIAFSSPPADPVPFFLPPPDDKPFTSFFSDPDERAAALSAIPGHCREEGTDQVMAFGQPIPDVTEWEFQPPEELLTEEAMQASQRQRRLLKRRSHG
ncbi:hypothetical protein N7466_003113 [Penicillium verhagenii]|uniref:uncharacterized protein n=1 Tax=Penicillium verhagenii TaxID=1562060 RepID=UPI0025452675|nr:uncharacterized protein N7466_003113 [Penicillium verhagenii]KAJ5936663.1 hypothetical protein N7466_003113 [Penicillium verhagenii]